MIRVLFACHGRILTCTLEWPVLVTFGADYVRFAPHLHLLL